MTILHDAIWQAPRELSGVKSRKRAIFEIALASVDASNDGIHRVSGPGPRNLMILEVNMNYTEKNMKKPCGHFVDTIFIRGQYGIRLDFYRNEALVKRKCIQ